MKEEIAQNREMSLTPLVLESRGADKTVVCPLFPSLFPFIR